MKKLYSILLASVFSVLAICAYAQGPVTAADCSDAVNICSNASFSVDPNGSGQVYELSYGTFSNPSSNPASSNSGCLLSGELNSTWMIVNIASNGNLEFSFGQPSTGCFDWIMWPYTPNTCSQILNNQIAPVRCNWNGSCNGFTGIAATVPAGGYASNFEPPLPVTCGQQFLICLSNYSSQTTTVPLNFFGSASVSCVTVTPVQVNSPTICQGSSATLTATGANSYTWNPSPTLSTTSGPTAIATPTVTTTYTVTGSGSCGTGSATATVTVIPSPSVTVSPAAPSICTGQNVTLTASGANSYTWSPPTGLSNTTGSSVIASPSGTTTYTVTGSNSNCTDTQTVVVTVNQTPTVTVTPSSTTICTGGSVTLTASGATTYTWQPAQTLNTNTGSTVIATPTASQIYMVTGANGNCTDNATAVVTVSNPFTVNAGPDVSICAGSSTTLTATGGPAGSTYSWSPTTGLSNPNSASTTCNATTTTTYTVTVTSNNCSATDVITVTVNPNPTLATAGFPPACSNTCDGQVVVIPSNGTQPYSYAWSNGCTTPSCNNLCPGTYSITVTDAMGCTVTGSATVPVTSPITLTTSTTFSTCGQPDGSVCVQASGGNPGYTYSWNTSPAQTSSCATGMIPGNYCVTVTDINGCTATACDSVPSTPGITASICSSADPSCPGSCDGTATVCVSGGTLPYTFVWSDGQTTATAIGLCSGTYTVTATDAQGCTDVITVTLVDPSPVTATPSSDVTICIGQTTSLTATASGGTGGTYTFDWDNGTFTGPAYNVSPTVTTTYNVYAIDSNGCQSPAQPIIVTVHPPLDVTASGGTAVCPGGSATLTAAGSGGDGNYTFTWLPAPSGTGQSITVTVNTTTTFSVIITDQCGTPSDTDTVTVFASPQPIVNFTATTVEGCNPVCTDFNDQSIAGSGTIVSWLWDFGDNSTPATIQNPTNHCYGEPGSYDVTLTVINSAGCQETFTINNMITVHDFPIPDFSFGPQPATLTNPQICFTDLSGGNPATWSWDFDDPSDPATSSLQNPCFSYSDTGIFCPRLTVSNAFGCTSDTSYCLVISPEFTFYIPNAFSPNQDGINDFFSGTGMFFTDYEMFIFDRWGNQIFYTQDITRQWDGRANQGNKVAQQDVYVYVVKLKDIFDKEHKYIGHVTLLK